MERRTPRKAPEQTQHKLTQDIIGFDRVVFKGHLPPSWPGARCVLNRAAPCGALPGNRLLAAAKTRSQDCPRVGGGPDLLSIGAAKPQEDVGLHFDRWCACGTPIAELSGPPAAVPAACLRRLSADTDLKTAGTARPAAFFATIHCYEVVTIRPDKRAYNNT